MIANLLFKLNFGHQVYGMKVESDGYIIFLFPFFLFLTHSFLLLIM